MLYDVILPLAIDGVLTYNIPESVGIQPLIGMRAFVPLGKKKIRTGIIYREHTAPLPEGQTIEIKDVICLPDEQPLVNTYQLRLWEWIADYYMCSLGEVMKAALPTILKPESETHVCLNPEAELSCRLNATQQRILDCLADGKERTIDELCRLTGIRNALPAILRLQEMQAVFTGEQVENRYRPRTEKRLQLSDQYRSEAALHSLLDLLERAKRQQQLLLCFLSLAEDSGWVRREELLSLSGVSPAILKTLTDKGVLEQREVAIEKTEKDVVFSEAKPLSHAQQQAMESIQTQWKEKEVVLLHGVTGSGKTEIYIHLIQAALLRGEQVLYLVPEIALTTQLTERLQKVFGNKLCVWHSRFSDQERADIYNLLLKPDSCKVVLGVRSSVFLPFSRLRLVIVDEEHDSSYKQQDPAPRYHARNAALVLARQAGAKVLLGTATPAVETYYNAMQGKYGLVELLLRHGNIPLPRITTIDTRLCYKRKEMTGHFSDPLVHKLSGELERHKQVIVFRNRRGYAPWLSCPQCGYVPKCVNCDISLTVHKRQGTLVCHYCGYTIPLPQSCPVCGETALADHGMGTEKIEDELHELFPKARVARMDLDTTRTKYGYQRIIDDFADRKTDILVGTQMVTKGLDFDGVSTVAVLSADSLSNMPDFRSSERAYQQLEQVSGRAGRRDEQGEVIIQTATPDSALLRYVAAHDYKAMYAEQITEREAFRYPPFYRLIEVSVSHHDLHQADVAAAALQTRLQAVFTRRCSRVIQPVIGKVQNRYIRTILLKIEASAPYAKAKQLIHEQIRLMQQTVSARSAVISIDVDPM